MDIGRLNININGIASTGFNGNHAVFEEIGTRLGILIPDDYVSFIRTVDGGHPEIGSFVVPGSSPENFFDVSWFYSFANPQVENIQRAIDRWANVLGPRNLPIGKDGGGNQIYLNFNEPVVSVWLYLHDENGAKIKVADSFEAFIAGLTANPDFI